jgi:hypothetical protein
MLEDDLSKRRQREPLFLSFCLSLLLISISQTGKYFPSPGFLIGCNETVCVFLKLSDF